MLDTLLEIFISLLGSLDIALGAYILKLKKGQK